MAAARSKAATIGSAQWVQKERDQAAEFVEQEVEEFGYSVRNEMEWLNEHMAEIFSTNAVNYADVFKTPGKLRGKTPRTVRKREALEQRQPLTDIFAPNSQISPTPAKSTPFYDKVTRFQIAEDGENSVSQQRPLSRSKSPQRVGKPGNIDSGYHGMTEDELEADTQTDADTVPSQSLETYTASHENQIPTQKSKDGANESEPVSDESFMSAKEGASQDTSKVQVDAEIEEDNATVPDDDMEVDAPDAQNEQEVDPELSHEPADEPEAKAEPEPIEDLDVGMSHEPSETSSPAQPLQRKSSFTFSSLPAREPLTAKRSIGGRNSNMEAMNRNSVFAKSIGKSFGITHDDGELSQEKSEDAMARGKTSAQLLHERISMLGKAKDSRSSKSIPQALYPQLPQADAEEDENDTQDAPEPPPKDGPTGATVDDEDDDWIAPSKPMPQRQPEQAPSNATPSRPMHKKAISTTVIPSPSRDAIRPTSRLQKTQSVVMSGRVSEPESTTPAGSPASKKNTEQQSASKKLWSAFKSARSLFASSAGSSAAAKLEAHDSPAGKKSKKQPADEAAKANFMKMPGALWSETTFSQTSSRPMSALSGSPSRKTRSSTESDKRKEKDLKAQQKAADELEKAREKERQKANKAQEERFQAERAEAERKERELSEIAAAEAAAQTEQRPATAESEKDREDMPPPPPPKNPAPTGRLRAPSRPVKPTREAVNTKSKPAPVNIRIAAQSQRLNQPSSQDSLPGSKQENAPPPPPKTGLRTNSAQSNSRSSTMPQNNSRVRALEAAARKKEQEEREKQRKADQKRELERKRAAKAEEDRRIEQEKKTEEQRKLQESRLAAQRQAEKQAAEAKRREQQRIEQQQQRQEQQRQDQLRLEQSAAAKAKAAHELAEAIARERAEKQPMPRGDAPGTLRQLGQRTIPDPSVRQIPPNPAKPPKRVLQQEDDDASAQAQRPGVPRNPPSYQQNEAKRRKTEELEQEADQRHSVMAPPKRPSTMRKETLPKFSHGYAHAPPPAAHHSSMFKSTVTSQHQLQHGQRPAHPSQTVQVSNGRIPFAENANPPAAQYHPQHPQAYQGTENASQSKFKTPARPPAFMAPKSAKSAKSAKSSPMYPNGDNIALPEIMTDSEDEDDEDDDATGGFRAPSWVASPALRDLLTQQQLVDPETVFGPISDLKMEEVFKGAKNQERLKRFRDRGSSAMWVETGDAVTSAEKQRDMEARERVYKEGGWSYHNRV
ncbi:hypothetical protein WHR41_07793 [Cladosporium halotolerans]|uniref:Inner centromere protein ARK-binding domain-containing protein n=1 Tax=Cladosporium halotolerans TaxID=1052096 RepID=A0AB34KJ80_9PEZI